MRPIWISTIAAAALLAGCGQSPAASSSVGGSSGQSPAGGSPAAGSGGASAAGQGGGGTASVGGNASGAGAGGVPTAGSGGVGGAAGAAGMAGASGAAGSGTGTGCSGPTLCWDFEEGALPSGWTRRFDEGAGELVVDDTRPFGASKYSLHAKGIQGGAPKQSIIYQLPATFGPMLWGRARVYTSPTRPEAHAGLFAAYYVPVGANSAAMNTLDWYEVASYTQKYMSIWHPPWPPGFPESVQVSDTLLVLDEWTCLEWQFDGQNGTEAEAARPRMWLNGVELAWPTKFGFSEQNGQNEPEPVRRKATRFTVIEAGVTMWQPMPTPNDWWLDDLAVGQQRIGCAD